MKHITIRSSIDITYMKMLCQLVGMKPSGPGVALPGLHFTKIDHIVEVFPIGSTLIRIQSSGLVHLVSDVIIRYHIVTVLVCTGITQGIDSTAIEDALTHQVMDKVVLYYHIPQHTVKTIIPSVSNMESGIRYVENFVIRQIHICCKAHRNCCCGLIIHRHIMDIVVDHITVLHHHPDIRRITDIFRDLRIADIDGTTGNIIEMISCDPAVLHTLHQLQRGNTDSGKITICKVDGVCFRNSYCSLRKQISDVS